MNISNSWLYHKVIISNKEDVILVVCNRLSKIAYFVTITEWILVEKLARPLRTIYRNYIGCLRVWFQIKNHSLQWS